MRRERKRRIVEERRSDEESLYYVLERDLDREAVFPHHDGWYSQASIGRRKRIDYILRYGSNIYGIEVKTGLPRVQDFRQAERYYDAFNGVFLAYPSDRVGEALFLSESKEVFLDVGLLSLTLFRSHIMRRTRKRRRGSEQTWRDYLFDERRYWSNVETWSWERADGLPATALEDGCLWTSFDQKGDYNKEKWYRLPLTKSDWQALGVLYGITLATSVDKFFSHEYLWKLCRKVGWKSFYPWGLVRCDLAEVRTYGDRMWTYSLSFRGHYLLGRIRKALKEELGQSEWEKLKTMTSEWKREHRAEQRKCEVEFAR